MATRPECSRVEWRSRSATLRVADALCHGHLLELYYVCLGADLHRRFPILYP